MSEQNMSFETILAKILHFFERYFNLLVLFFVLVIATSIGYYFYQRSQQAYYMQATDDYFQATLIEDNDKAKQAFIDLIKNYPGTDQAAFAHLDLAKRAYAAGDKQSALTNLEGAVIDAKVKSQKMIYVLKLAELYLDIDPSKTISTLKVREHNFKGITEAHATYLKVLAYKKMNDNENYLSSLTKLEEVVKQLNENEHLQIINHYARQILIEKAESKLSESV